MQQFQATLSRVEFTKTLSLLIKITLYVSLIVPVLIGSLMKTNSMPLEFKAYISSNFQVIPYVFFASILLFIISLCLLMLPKEKSYDGTLLFKSEELDFLNKNIHKSILWEKIDVIWVDYTNIKFYDYTGEFTIKFVLEEDRIKAIDWLSDNIDPTKLKYNY